MKTVFKEGMEVYDQLNFPNKKGVIVEISNDENDPYPVEVSFENEAGRYYFTPEGRFRKEHIPTLSTKSYKIELQGFEQKSPAKTYEDAVKWLESTENTEIMNDSVFLAEGNYYTNLNTCAEALKKLILLRDYYNEGCQPNWKNDNFKYCIQVYKGDLEAMNYNTIYKVMYFKSSEIRDKFLEEQRELLEIAKPLL